MYKSLVQEVVQMFKPLLIFSTMGSVLCPVVNSLVKDWLIIEANLEISLCLGENTTNHFSRKMTKGQCVDADVDADGDLMVMML